MFDPLTPFWTAVTFTVETVLGLSCMVMYLKVIPWFASKHQKTFMGIVHEKGYNNRFIDFLFDYVPSPWRVTLPRKAYAPNYRLLWWDAPFQPQPVERFYFLDNPKLYLKGFVGFWGIIFLRAFSFVIILGVALTLATAKGWTDAPIAFLARVNGAPNGAHLASYLAIPGIALVVLFKYRNEPLALLASAFLVGVHEFIWSLFYYAAYAQYLDPSQITSIVKEISSMFMYGAFLYTWVKYPLQKIPLRIFKWPVIVFIQYLVFWFIAPAALGYHALPITTINNYKYGHTVYAETDYWNNPYVESIEIIGWLLPFALSAYQIIKVKTNEVVA